LATNPALASPMTFTDTNAGTGGAFYRVHIRPNP
jgi:hypothetical protein